MVLKTVEHGNLFCGFEPTFPPTPRNLPQPRLVGLHSAHATSHVLVRVVVTDNCDGRGSRHAPLMSLSQLVQSQTSLVFLSVVVFAGPGVSSDPERSGQPTERGAVDASAVDRALHLRYVVRELESVGSVGPPANTQQPPDCQEMACEMQWLHSFYSIFELILARTVGFAVSVVCL